MRNITVGLVALFLVTVCLNASAGFWRDWYGDWHEGYTKFHDAAKVGDVEKLAYYLKKGTDINQKSRSAQCTALGCAVRWRQYNAAKFLLEQGANPSIPFRFAGVYRTPLQVAAASGRMSFVQLLVSHVDSPDEGMDVPYPQWCRSSAFTWACSLGHLDIAQYLLGQGANVNIRNGHNSGTPLVESVKKLRIDSVRFLLENGADVAVTDKSRNLTPMGWCEAILDAKFISVSGIVRLEKRGNPTESELRAGTNACHEIMALLKGKR
ncbi:MAG: ankyrin repeat domain-containing protein [Kiritimatiellales bacterium]|nr:ankyrin repeat domain-containing protein [Kiritimatiellales bacterium]